jgi:VWFA-related protein
MTRGTAALALCAIVMAAAPVARARQQTAPPPVQFETRADLILIDATVVDERGAPVPDLTPADFVVSVDDQPRPIASVQFVKLDPPAAAPPRAPKASHYSTNEGEADGRRIMIVVDENSIAPGGARAVLASVERLLKDLSPSDRVGYIRVPQFENAVDFTTDRGRVLDALKTTTGKARRLGMNRVTLAESAAYERRDAVQWQRALARICSASAPSKLQGARPAPSGGVAFDPADEYEFCRQEAEGEAQEQITTFQRRARETLDGLAQVVTNLRHVPGPKTLILLSQGFLSYDYRPDISKIADLAASARVSLYALHIDMRSMDLDVADSSFTREADEQLMADGIDTLVGASRGTRFRIAGTGEGVFARVARELSGYYLIGLEPTEGDRDGKPHRIKVQVRRPSAAVRARAQFTMNSSTAAVAAPAAAGERLVELLRAATMDAGVPLRLAAFATPAPTPDRVRVILSAEIGAATVSPIEVQLGYLLVDADGNVPANQFLSVVLRPDVPGEPSLPRYVGHADVPPGEYTVRFAAIDPEGRTGSVHHPVVAKVKEAGTIAVSDLILAAPSGRASVRPEVHLNLERESLRAMLELRAADGGSLNATTITFDVAEDVAAAPIVTETGALHASDGPVKPAAATLNVGVLPPGDYVARALVMVPGHRPITLTRPFQVAPRRRGARTAAPETDRSAARAVSRGRTRPPIPPFKPADVLAPAVVNPFIDHVLTNYSPSPAGRAALTAIKDGNLQQATKGERQVADVALSFAQGLGMLAENRTAEADAYFRAALRSESDFIGAAFYLGATLAAAGKDRDAVAAWQTALIGEVGTAGVYPVLIDGLLRLGEGEHALDLLKEAEPTFTDRLAYDRRLVQTYALMGRYGDALPLAHACLGKRPDDIDLLFLTMHMIFEAHSLDDLQDAAAELERFRDYSDRYAAAKGPQTVVVQGWRKALGIR